MAKRIDMTDQQFGILKVVGLSEKRNKSNTLLWECLCECGKTAYILGISLRAGYYKSCGCVREEKRDRGARNHEKLDSVDGTRLTALTSKLHVGNKSGHKGIRFYEQRGKWTAHIGFKRKQILLGYHTTMEAAIKARADAEALYYKPHLENDNQKKK